MSGCENTPIANLLKDDRSDSDRLRLQQSIEQKAFSDRFATFLSSPTSITALEEVKAIGILFD